MMFYSSAHEWYRVFWKGVERIPLQIITFGSWVWFTSPLARTQKEVYAFACGRVVMGDANNLEVGLIDFHSYLFPTFADGCLFDGLASLKMSSNRAVVPIFKPGVGSSQQEN
jgi:hypothetical protein